MSPRRLFRRPLAASLLGLVALSAHAAGRPVAGDAVAMRDGVVVDAARSVAYVMSPKGGVEAVDLRHGASLWRSTEGERPLALFGNLLVAQALPGAQGELRIVALDSRQKGVRAAEADLPMPSGVRASVAETLQSLFRVSALASSQGLLITWVAEPRPTLPHRSLERIGVASADEKTGVLHTASGGFRGDALFDPRAGRLMPLAATEAELLRGERKGSAVELPDGIGPERHFVSLDGRHLLTSRRLASGSSGNTYLWTVSERESRAILGALETRISMSPFLVAHGQLIYVAQPTAHQRGAKSVEQPLRLRALDLSSGTEAWSRSVRDIEFRGPTPD